ncbi:MAG TPA: superoxide dismutase family protein [Acidimicrobiales bacterium]
MRTTTTRIIAGLGAAAVLAAGAATVATTARADNSKPTAWASLVDTTGADAGHVWFYVRGDTTRVRVKFDHASATTDAFHGFHLHGNLDGAGCVAPSFTSVGGHWADATHATHADHLGDMPSLYVFDENGRSKADVWFHTKRIDPAALVGRAVIVHAGPDNFANIPTRYAPAPDTATLNTGDAGGRIACGVVQAANG